MEISPVRTNAFKFALRESNQSNATLSGEARKQLLLDAQFLETELLKNKVHRLRNAHATGVPSKNALKYNAKLLAQHYQISTRTVRRILRRGRTSSVLDAKHRPGRPVTTTVSHVSFMCGSVLRQND